MPLELHIVVIFTAVKLITGAENALESFFFFFEALIDCWETALILLFIQFWTNVASGKEEL